MEVSIRTPLLVSRSSINLPKSTINSAKPNPNLLPRGWSNHSTGKCRFPTRISVIDDVASATGPIQAEVTWQIVVGTIAGVTPFVVAGIEFGKRIIAQRKCQLCGGSGLVQRDEYYFRCPGCGGFLPWQSWRRFFSG